MMGRDLLAEHGWNAVAFRIAFGSIRQGASRERTGRDDVIGEHVAHFERVAIGSTFVVSSSPSCST